MICYAVFQLSFYITWPELIVKSYKKFDFLSLRNKIEVGTSTCLGGV